MNEEQRQMDLALAECEAENRLLRARNERLMKEVDLLTEALRGKQEQGEPVARYCCHSCFKASGGVMLDRMILCSECGNKRCPKATDHNFSCTGSNEPGQWGSIYTQQQPKQEQDEPVAWVCYGSGEKHDIDFNEDDVNALPVGTMLYTTPQPKQEQGEPVALKQGECWPEEVMKQWDYWRKEIANGHKGSAPRDWFEGLSELKLIDTTTQQRKPLTVKQLHEHWQVAIVLDMTDAEIDFADYVLIARDVEALYGIKE